MSYENEKFKNALDEALRKLGKSYSDDLRRKAHEGLHKNPYKEVKDDLSFAELVEAIMEILG